MIKIFRIHTILFCIGLCISIGCSDEAINNAVSPATEDTEKIVREKDNTLRITGYEKGPFEWFDSDGEGQYEPGIYVATYQGKEVWLYGFFGRGDLVVGTTIEEPEIVDEWLKKVTHVRTEKKQTVLFLEIEIPD